MRRSLQFALAFCPPLATGAAMAQTASATVSAFDELRREVGSLRTTIAPEVTEVVRIQMTNVRDCGNMEYATSAVRPAGESSSQYIYNADYSWSIVEAGPYQCVYLTRPELRALSQDEAHDLLLASEMPFPVPPTGLSEPMPDATPVDVVPRFRGDDNDVHLSGDSTMASGTTRQRVVPMRGTAPPSDDR